MSERVSADGHYEETRVPSLPKGEFQAVGSFIGEGEMTTVSPRGISVNVKTGKLQNGEQ